LKDKIKSMDMNPQAYEIIIYSKDVHSQFDDTQAYLRRSMY